MNHPNSSLYRTVDENEADSIINITTTFYDYTVAVAQDSTATTQDFQETLDIQTVNSLVENSFNYYFARLDYQLVSKIHDTYEFDATLEQNGKISINNSAKYFNRIRQHLKTVYDNNFREDLKLTLVDVEINESTITVNTDFSYEAYPEVSNPMNISFGVDDNWTIWDQGGYTDASNVHHNLSFGSPEVLRYYVLANLGYVNAGTSSFPINITFSGNPAPGGVNVNTTSLPTNPLSSSYFKNYTLLWTSSSYPQTNPPDIVPYQGMEYFRVHGIPYHITYCENLNSKTMIDFTMGATVIPNNTVNREHWISIETADLVPVTPNSPVSL